VIRPLSFVVSVSILGDTHHHIRSEKFTPQQKGTLAQLIQQYRDVLTAKLGLNHLMKYCIPINATKPVTFEEKCEFPNMNPQATTIRVD
jgi:hypothetical protein